jgi:hypothetical protein
MENKELRYEKPTVTDYGTLRDLTLGTGGTQTPDVAPPCDAGTFQSNGPSGITCKVNA